ncbi:MAG: hypothetical protein H0U61_10705 [Nocardioidaceae bacterium]|nr:hypothetical protein [Nocardioidaceae bacterium]
MANGSDQMKQKVERRRGKAERAAAAVQMHQDRLAAAAKADDQAQKRHRGLKDSLAKANKTAKQLSKEATEALELKKSALKERRSAEKDLARNQDLAAKHLAKLVELQAAETTQDATDQLHAGNAEDAIRTAGETVPAKSTRSCTSSSTANKSAAKKTTSGSRGATTRKAVTKRASATTNSAAKRSTAKKTSRSPSTGSRNTAKTSTAKSSTANRTAAKSPAKRSPTKRTTQKRS